MRRVILTLLSSAPLCLGAPAVGAAEGEAKPVRLVCKYSYTVDDQGKRSATSGETLFTVSPLRDSRVTVLKQGLGAQFAGTMTDAELSADVTYEIGNVKYAESLAINRFTGELQVTIRVGKGGLTHFGTCRPATQPLF